MDYDNIVKGRRRNWDPLKPDEVRQREKEEERLRREEERLKRTGSRFSGFFRLRDHLMDVARVEDERRFRAATRQASILGILFVVAFLGWLAVEHIITARARELFLQQASQYETQLDGKANVFNLEDPLSAFTSWRSAWIREDYPALVRTFSTTYLRRSQPKGDVSTLIADFRKMSANGGMEVSVTLAASFGDPEPLKVPRKPWKDGELAVFRSEPIIAYGEERYYTAAMIYDEKSGTWRFADIRESKYFSVRWKTEKDILPLKVGPTATYYDEDGYEVGADASSL